MKKVKECRLMEVANFQASRLLHVAVPGNAVWIYVLKYSKVWDSQNHLYRNC